MQPTLWISFLKDQRNYRYLQRMSTYKIISLSLSQRENSVVASSLVHLYYITTNNYHLHHKTLSIQLCLMANNNMVIQQCRHPYDPRPNVTN